MLVRGQNHCCCKKPGQCTRRYNFDDSLGSMDVAQFRSYDDPDGSTPVTVYWDYGAGELDIEGEGCYAVEIIPASVTLKTIHVATMVSALTTGSVGVTIRRPESAESISLWWLSGTSYELRHGTTVIESITHTAATDEIKLELTTPKDPTTDVLVYIGGALVHTESAVAFVMPDVLNLGVAINGEATVDWVEVSPCPVVCGTSSDCDAIAGVPIPKIWTVEVPDTTDSGSGCAGYCESFAGTFRLLTIKELAALVWFEDGATPMPANWYWRTGGVSGYRAPIFGEFYCVFAQIRDTKGVDVSYWMDYDSFVYGQPENTIDPAAWPIDARWVCDDPPHPSYPYSGVGTGLEAAWVLGFELDPINPTANYRLSLVTIYRVHTTNSIVDYYVKYSSAYYLTNDPTPLQGGPITLNLDVSLDGSPLTTGCEFPATVTVTPGTDAEFMGRLCETGCTPPVTPQPGTCYVQSINLVDVDDNPWRMTAVLGVQFDDTTGSWYWEGTATPHPLAKPHPACGDIIFGTVKIHCVELEEGASKTWVLDFTYDGQTERFPMTEDPQFGFVWEGTTDIMCSGQTWDFFAGPINPTESTYQFGSCEWNACADPHGYYFAGQFSTECDGGLGYTQHSGWIVFSPTSPRPWMIAPVGTVYYSPVPYGYSGQVAGIFLYVESGTVRVQLVDGSLDPIPDMFASVGYSCDPIIGRPVIDDTSPISYLWGFPSPVTSDPFGICEGTTGFGSWEITFP